MSDALQVTCAREEIVNNRVERRIGIDLSSGFPYCLNNRKDVGSRDGVGIPSQIISAVTMHERLLRIA